MRYDSARALELLRIGAGRPDAQFREGQEEAIRHMVEGRGRLLVVQKTGWGKSFVYFVVAKLLREAGTGPSILVSPLLSLMRNQIAAAERMGLRAATIHSGNQDEWGAIEKQVTSGNVDILLISPERLANDRFTKEVLSKIAASVGLLVVDEAHCISDWGHDFRPHYRLLERLARGLPANLRLLATTATANDRVIEDLKDVLGPALQISRGDLVRDSLTLQTIRLPNQAERLAWLAERLDSLPGHGIIYTLTVHDAHQVTEWLNSRGFEVKAYTGQSEDRDLLEDALLNNEVKALVATMALGMGFDKPDISFVIHYQTPGSVVAYYQQVGRAGRSVPSAYGVLLSGEEDLDITNWFIKSAFPTRDEVRLVLAALEESPDGLSIPALLGQVNISMTRAEKTMALLSLESPAPVVKEGSRYQLTAAKLSPSFWDRAERLTRLRIVEQEQMQAYVGLPFGEHMNFLVEALDGGPSQATGPSLPPLPTSADDGLIREAVAFLRQTSLPIEPRKKWPVGGMPRYGVSGSIGPAHRHETGRALCRWGDPGWSRLVRKGKFENARFSDDLVAACVEMISAWQPEPFPEWVTCVPSLRHPVLVPEFAARVAAELGLPFHKVLHRTEQRPEQKSMANSTQQARNVDGSLRIGVGLVPAAPVLLIDDIVDSRWTLTVAAWLLREGGSQQVWPMVLATAGAGT